MFWPCSCAAAWRLLHAFPSYFSVDVLKSCVALHNRRSTRDVPAPRGAAFHRVTREGIFQTFKLAYNLHGVANRKQQNFGRTTGVRPHAIHRKIETDPVLTTTIHATSSVFHIHKSATKKNAKLELNATRFCGHTVRPTYVFSFCLFKGGEAGCSTTCLTHVFEVNTRASSIARFRNRVHESLEKEGTDKSRHTTNCGRRPVDI